MGTSPQPIRDRIRRQAPALTAGKQEKECPLIHTSFESPRNRHYTSVPNTLKTIDPLFMVNLRGQFEEGDDSPKTLTALLERISEINVFDPACGSGNFLIIAYKELRRLEHGVLDSSSKVMIFR